MRFYITACCLLFGVMLVGCTRPPETKPQPPLPIASGQINHAIIEEENLRAEGVFTNYNFGYRTHTITDGHIDIYESGVAIITDTDGTKHCMRVGELHDLSFR